MFHVTVGQAKNNKRMKKDSARKRKVERSRSVRFVSKLACECQYCTSTLSQQKETVLPCCHKHYGQLTILYSSLHCLDAKELQSALFLSVLFKLSVWNVPISCTVTHSKKARRNSQMGNTDSRKLVAPFAAGVQFISNKLMTGG